MIRRKNSNTFSSQIDPSLARKLKNDLKDQGFSFTKPPYSIFSAQKRGVVCTLYTSGKLIVQGKDKDEFIEFYLEPEILKTFEYTHPEAHVDMMPRIGVDEAGKGDFFGPLCVGAIYADEEGIKKLISMGVADSKRFSDSTIIKIAREIKKSFSYSVVSIFPEKYNELYSKFRNLNHLLGWAHASAIFNLFQKTSCKNVIIDQFADKRVVESAVYRKKIKIDLKQRHKGESDIVVAAASIIARAYFIAGLEKLEKILGMKLPKGASQKVIDQGVKIAAKYGKEQLKKYAKLHFKTYRDILKS